LVQRLSQLIQQPRILDGDDGLRGKVLYQINLLVSEWAYFQTIDSKRTNEFVFLEHRY